MKKRLFIPVVLVIVLLLICTACGKTDSPEKTVKGYVDAVLALDSDAMSEYMTSDSPDVDIFSTDVTRELAESLFSYITVKDIVLGSEGESEATVTLIIEGPNISKLQDQTIEKSMEVYFSEDSITSDDLNEALVEQMKTLLEDADLDEYSVSVEVVEEDGKWLLPEESQDEILNLLAGEIGPVEIVE